MKIEIPYGKTRLAANIPDGYAVEIVTPKQHAPAPDPDAVVRDAIQHLTGEIRSPQAGQTVSIAINDKTRPVPHDRLLPPLLDWLHQRGIARQDITFVIATGTHPVMPREEYSRILPQDIVDAYRIVCHDAYAASDLIYVGKTSRGTPVYTNEAYYAADYHVVVGNIEPHQFMGFSGGVKSAAIGVSGVQTINHNHSMMMDEMAALGEYDLNPARQDVEEIGQLMRVDFALNAILNSQKQIITVLAGDPVRVMQVAIPRVREIYQVRVNTRFDLVIASPGGHPKDINVYQAQKALAHATMVTKEGGGVILCAACPEGTGSKSYEAWITDPRMTDHHAVFERFRQEGFHVGPHKAFQISRDATRVHVMLISEMEAGFVHKLLLEPVSDLQTAVDSALLKLPSGARIGVLPTANSTIPHE